MGTSFQTHIRDLHQAGIATHIVENADVVDPVFALSKVRDFPEISFAAVFEDGSIVLGCHGDLPDPLANIAQPIPPSEAPQPDAPTPVRDAIEGRLDRISAALDQHARASQSLNDRLDDIENGLKSGHDTITAKLSDVSALAAIQQQIAALPEVMGPAPDIASLTAPLHKTTQDIAKAVAHIEATMHDDAPDRITQILTGFEERLLHQTASLLPAEGFVDITTRQDAMLQALDSVASELSIVAAQQSNVTDVAAQRFNVEDITDRLSVLQDMDGKLGEITGAVQALTAAADTSSPDTSFNQLSMQINALAAEVTAVSQRPDPSVDMTEQRLGFARFQTAISTVLARFEAETERLCALQPDDSDPAIVHLSDQIESLTAQIAPMNELRNEVTTLGADLKTLPEQSAAIAKALADLKQRPDPVLDLTEQRRSLAYFANAIGTAIARLETVASQLDKDEAMAEILARLDANQTAAQPDTSPHEFADMLQTQSDEITRLRATITTHLQQPGPVLDLTMQRASLAQFGTAMGVMLNRLEKVASDIEAAPGIAESPAPIMHTPPQQQLPEPRLTSFADDRISLDALRHSFAELIAKQIMDNALSDAKTEICGMGSKH